MTKQNLWTCFDGTKHPVSDAFVERVPADLNGASLNQVVYERDRLYALVNGDLLLRPKPHLSNEEATRLDGCIDVLNLNRALKWLDGRDYKDVFGHKATLDQVHGNAFGMSCGCVLQGMFDHSARDQKDNKVHPHFPAQVCKRHKDVAKSFITLHNTVVAECAKRDNRNAE